jgi:hypothetical protein
VFEVRNTHIMRSDSTNTSPEKHRPHRKIAKRPYPPREETNTELRETLGSIKHVLEELPDADNEPGAVDKMLRANAILRNSPWPPPFDLTTHRLQLGDARQLQWIPADSVHLVVTSPPYWTLKRYEANDAQMGAIPDYEHTTQEYSALLLRISRMYDERFGE